MKLPDAKPCRSGCGMMIKLMVKRGGTWAPFDAELVAAQHDSAELGYVPHRRNGVAVLVPVRELPDDVVDLHEWRVMQHRCDDFRFSARVGAVAESLLAGWGSGEQA